MEQRLKIIKAQSIGSYEWDYEGSSYENDWTQATLMQMLNGVYYSSDGSDTAKCYKSGTLRTCKFDGIDGRVRGLSDLAKKK